MITLIVINASTLQKYTSQNKSMHHAAWIIFDKLLLFFFENIHIFIIILYRTYIFSSRNKKKGRTYIVKTSFLRVLLQYNINNKFFKMSAQKEVINVSERRSYPYRCTGCDWRMATMWTTFDCCCWNFDEQRPSERRRKCRRPIPPTDCIVYADRGNIRRKDRIDAQQSLTDDTSMWHPLPDDLLHKQKTFNIIFLKKVWCLTFFF